MQPVALTPSPARPNPPAPARQLPPRAHTVHIGLARAREYVRAHVAAPLSLDGLARVACLSKFHFLRAFTRAYGVSPREYQMQRRLALARTLVEAGEALSSVAYDTGFADQSHLTRRFKQAFGMTPGAYARQARATQRAA
jgi:AraC-like DNA-binding protein